MKYEWRESFCSDWKPLERLECGDILLRTSPQRAEWGVMVQEGYTHKYCYIRAVPETSPEQPAPQQDEQPSSEDREEESGQPEAVELSPRVLETLGRLLDRAEELAATPQTGDPLAYLLSVHGSQMRDNIYELMDLLGYSYSNEDEQPF